ncbi:hypothetical protein Tco_0467566 [Tanacetum coccineum]
MFKDSNFDVLDDAMKNVEGGSTVEQITTARDTLNTASINVSTVGPSNGSSAGPSTSTTRDIFKDEMTTIANTLVAIRSARPRTTSVVIHNVEEEPKRAIPVPTVQSQDKGRKKFFAAKRVAKIRNRPPTRTQLRNQMITYLKHMGNGKKDDSSSKQAESSKKRPRAEHDEESVKKQKLQDDAKKEELRACLDIVQGDDITIDVKSLDIVPASLPMQRSQIWISQVAHAEEPPTSFDELNDTSFDFSAFVINWLKIPNLTQEILVGPTFNLIKVTCKSITELEYHLEEYHQGRQIIPKDYFINKDLEYLKGGDLSRKYSTSVTKTKAATYELKWIKDLVIELWSPVRLKYDQHAYFGTSHWGPKHQRFYGYASNLTSSIDVYSRKRIIAVTRLIVMKKYDYGHLEEIEVHRDD